MSELQTPIYPGNQFDPAGGNAVFEAPDVSVVIPCLNEAQSVGLCIDKALAAFREHGIRGEVVVSDNGSTDGSIEIAKLHGARVVHATTRGYGNALRKGIEEARGEFIIMGDADDSYDFTEVPKFVEKWRSGSEFVMGNRFAGGIKPGAMPVSHQFVGNPALTAILNRFFNVGIGDAYCGMRGFTKRIYQSIDPRTTGMEFALELVIKASKMGANVTEVPITLWPDKRGRAPHLRTLHDGWRSLRFMLLYAPNWLFVGPGTFLLMFGLALVFWLLPGQAGTRIGPRRSLGFGRGCRFGLAGQRVDRRWLRSLRPASASHLLLIVVLSRCSDRFLFVLHQHARNQPRNL